MLDAETTEPTCSIHLRFIRRPPHGYTSTSKVACLVYGFTEPSDGREADRHDPRRRLRKRANHPSGGGIVMRKDSRCFGHIRGGMA